MKTCLITLLATFVPTVAALAKKASGGADPFKVSISQVKEGEGTITVRFENKMEVPLKLLQPLSGSEIGAQMPFYDLSVKDASGKELPYKSGCGTAGFSATMKWPDDYRIQIFPGHVYEMKLDIKRAIPATGDYSVTFHYTYDSGSGLARPHKGIAYPEDIWGGTASSKTVSMHLKQDSAQ